MITSPFLTKPTPLQVVMTKVLLALLPGIAVYVYVFGAGILIQLLLATLTALGVEAACLKLRNFPIKPFITDGSAIVTAWLLALSLPPLAPWWMIVLATAIAIGLAKHLYGGLGQNTFNPAMVGFAVLMVSFPAQMSRWAAPQAELDALAQLTYIFTGHLAVPFDAIASATPLDTVKTTILQHGGIGELFAAPLFQAGQFGAGWLPGMMGWIALAYLAGGVYLFASKIIPWQTPLSFLVSLAALAGALHLVDPARFTSPLFHLFSGAAMLGAFFIITDPVSGPTTPRGRLIYGALIGVLVYVIRVFGGYPDGVAFAVLIMNLAAPFIDQYTQPKVFGRKGKAA
ncbi:RnfABCDGE type electron transport complex subunit D [Jeongeupia naejangsanensis]|uniref:Ion-translocating oxidoreductase complex subunit D n=1 Tax=Jeongeupia naejangsanensis TaxID=613195 RepID=A0ABS2BLX4_9NEIS|nr:RnfABCDGE type electron transport complex subunit D [Jeongeupia naejangsanensis]MBM3116617.1 RnfABCDGE type electron transport complex subunit D [Jeongeupia naejangsanensis]